MRLPSWFKTPTRSQSFIKHVLIDPPCRYLFSVTFLLVLSCSISYFKFEWMTCFFFQNLRSSTLNRDPKQLHLLAESRRHNENFYNSTKEVWKIYFEKETFCEEVQNLVFLFRGIQILSTPSFLRLKRCDPSFPDWEQPFANSSSIIEAVFLSLEWNESVMFIIFKSYRDPWFSVLPSFFLYLTFI